MEEQNLPTKADELIAELANKDPLVLASISAVPYFGSTLATFFSTKWLAIYQERTAALFRKFGEHLNNLDEQTMKQDYFDTAEGIDLLIKAVEQSSRTRGEEKRDLIARILCGAIMDFEESEYSPEEYLYLLSALTVRELRVARSMYENRPEIKERGEEWIEWEKATQAEIGIEQHDLQLILVRLASAGLLQEVMGGDSEDKHVMWFNSPEYGESSYYRVMPVFDRLMEFFQLAA